ncbi:hypothetical protein OIDMADRAFT_57695 [Oidiodendron maius Zn]|uniref:Uncharacterized protein n=1 Tax=Oidiodendron maius (strain Zn) TaxID=913774 RepID=A0A0C3H4D0_OIDMZ|nr:hypothetical protein OIDMADRAFT_57695 [Oidiodendron maius Zn]
MAPTETNYLIHDKELLAIEQTRDLDQAKKDNREQVLLLYENLDQQIIQDLEVNRIDLSLSSIEDQLDLIDEILQANRIALDLVCIRKLGQQDKGGYTIRDGLLKRNRKLVVTQSVCTDLIKALHYGISIAHPRKHKTGLLIKE